MLFSTFKTHINSTHFTPSFVIILTTNVFHFCIVSLLLPTNASLKAQTPFTLHSTTQYIIKTKEAIIPSIILSSMTGKRSQISPLGRPSSGNIRSKLFKRARPVPPYCQREPYHEEITSSQCQNIQRSQTDYPRMCF